VNFKSKLINILKDYPLAVLCVVLILICGTVIFLRNGVALELSAKKADFSSRIRTIDQNVENTKGIGEEVDEVKLLVEQFQTRLFNREERAININFFYGLEDRLDVQITNISQMPSEDPVYSAGGPRAFNLHSTIGYNMSLRGQFDEILVFLYELYRVDPLIRVADLRMTEGNSRGAGSESRSLEARLKVFVVAEKD
jgi:hypothetical protein